MADTMVGTDAGKTLWGDAVCFGSAFAGGVIGNLTASLIWETSKWVAKPLLDKIPEITELLARGGHDKNHDLLRALRRSECGALVEIIDRCILEHSGIHIGARSPGEFLRARWQSRSDATLETLCKLRRTFRRIFSKLLDMPVEELTRLHGGSLRDLPSLINAGRECFETTDFEALRIKVTNDYIRWLADAVTWPARFAGFGKNELAAVATEGLPGILCDRLRTHPEGWWDYLRVAFREELKNPVNAAARTAWEMDVQSSLYTMIGSSFTNMSAQLDQSDIKLDLQLKTLRTLQQDVEEFANQILDRLDALDGKVDRQLGIAEQTRDITQEIQRSLAALLQRSGIRRDPAVEVDRLAQELEMTRAQVLGILRDILQTEIDPSRLSEHVMKARDRLVELNAELQRLRALGQEVPDIAPTIAQARAAVENPHVVDLAQAQESIRSARLRYRKELRQRREVEDRRDAQLTEAEANIAKTRFSYLEAAGLFAEAASLIPLGDNKERWRLKLMQADAIALRGADDPESHTLTHAIALYRREALSLAARTGDDLDMATTKNNLGDALKLLGEREREDHHLVEAVQLYREALQVRTRDRAPSDWATTQDGLANALSKIGGRSNDKDLLMEAAEAYRKALQVHTRARAPFAWAMIQNNLGLVLWKLGDCTGDNERLTEAIVAFRETLVEVTREKIPFLWATIQSNLGLALSKLGKRKGSSEMLSEALAAHRAALTVLTCEGVPLQWAAVQNNLANVLTMQGKREGGTERFIEAITVYRNVLRECTRERAPLDWAETQNNLGNVLLALGMRDSGTDRLAEAVTAYQEALQEITPERLPFHSAMTQNNFALALVELGKRENNAAKLDQAEKILTDAHEALRYTLAYQEIFNIETAIDRVRTLKATLRSQPQSKWTFKGLFRN